MLASSGWNFPTLGKTLSEPRKTSSSTTQPEKGIVEVDMEILSTRVAVMAAEVKNQAKDIEEIKKTLELVRAESASRTQTLETIVKAQAEINTILLFIRDMVVLKRYATKGVKIAAAIGTTATASYAFFTEHGWSLLSALFRK